MARADIRSELEKARRHLLELSTRNRLLSIPTSERAKLVRVDTEQGGDVFASLVRERRKLTFIPAAEESGPETEGSRRPSARTGGLRTTLGATALQSRLLSIHTDARIYIEEQGVNILYLALGQLKWFEDEQSSVERFAPLLLVPVRLERSNVASRFHLEALEEDPSDNLTLSARLTEFGVKLPAFEFDDEFSPPAYFEAVARSVASLPRWEVLPDAVVLGFFSFSKFLMYRDLDADNWEGGPDLDEHPLIQALLRDGFAPTADIVDESESLDALLPVERLNHVVDADTSQALAIEEVRGGRNLIIQGPPGTGKSQTITNLIATAVLDGKKVLFVAEKMAALEVVRRRIEQIGLGPLAVELHSHTTSKKAFVEELGRTLREGRPVCEGIERKLGQLRKARDELNAHAALLNTPLPPFALTPFQIIGQLARMDQDPAETPRGSLDGGEDWTPAEMEERENTVDLLAQRLAGIGAVEDHPWRGVRADFLSKFQAEEIHARVAETPPLLSALEDAGNRLCALLGRPAPDTPGAVDHARSLAAKAVDAPEHNPEAIGSPVWESHPAGIRDLLTNGLKYREIHDEIGTAFTPDAWEADFTDARRAVAAHGHSLFRFLRGDYRRALARIRGFLRDPRSLPRRTEERLHLLDRMIDGRLCRDRIKELSTTGADAFGALWSGLDSDWTKLDRITRWTLDLGDAPTAREVRRILALGPDREEVRAAMASAAAALTAFTTHWETLITSLALDLRRALGKAESAEAPMYDLAACLARWAAHPEGLSAWIQYDRLADTARTTGLGMIVDSLEAGATSPADALVHFRRAAYRRLFEEVVDRHPELKRFDGESHEKLIGRFRKLDETRIAIARYEVLAAHAAVKPPPQGAVGALGIVLGEIAKTRRHMSIRRLIGTAGSAVQAIKPVFMMSPLSVAQFLEPGKVSFDLVIFDEASQVKPVDALGAIARGRQMVVVGDSKQLPPSHFFARIDTTDEEEDEDDDPLAAAGDMESILTLAEGRGLPGKMLRWHYRSRHGSLIAVSNREFYGDGLYIIPSPLAEHPEFGLKFHHLPEAVYNRGARRKDNPVEARTVAEAVMRHAREHPGLSLGVAAFSVSQRDSIIDELESLRREDPGREHFFAAAHPHEPFFVKNLENVQGDERDVIFISVGYGRDQSGYFAMNFGPLNREGGERRLNVLISRAKNRCEVFSSIRSDDIDLARSPKAGVAALKTFLHYAETGILGTADPHTGREPDSPFEEAVKAALESGGHTVHSQVGVAGFFIDLAVVDPETPGRYLLGIECDGAAYHSSRSARERDRQRQAVLEDHGWTLHRIWSADWFLRPREQTAKVLKAIEAARRKTPRRAASGSTGIEIQWQESDDAEHAMDGLAEPYTEFSATPPPTPLNETPVEALAAYVRGAVEAEGPVHREEVLVRLRDLWGAKRAGRLIQTAVQNAVEFECENGSIVDDGAFPRPPRPRDPPARPQRRRLRLPAHARANPRLRNRRRRPPPHRAQPRHRPRRNTPRRRPPPRPLPHHRRVRRPRRRIHRTTPRCRRTPRDRRIPEDPPAGTGVTVLHRGIMISTPRCRGRDCAMSFPKPVPVNGIFLNSPRPRRRRGPPLHGRTVQCHLVKPIHRNGTTGRGCHVAPRRLSLCLTRNFS
ncbi:MAG: DUF3320 domain-containing protein [Opitutales bacterium]|nr:DUF3320 domain-containing protein [Opitutales bacterium]